MSDDSLPIPVCPPSVNIYAWLKLPHIIQQMSARARPKVVVTLSNLPEVIAFVKVAEVNPGIADVVRELTIDVRPYNLVVHEARATYCPTLRGILRLVPKVTDLTLLLPKATPPDVFFQVFFPDLRFFKTNVPHAKIRHFVGVHPSIAILVLGSCGQEERCALSASSLGLVRTVECNTRCIEAVAHTRLVHLAAENDSTAFCVPLAFRKLPYVMHDLYSLTLDFFPADTDILISIALVAPRVRKLKLLEKSVHVGRRISTRRPFNDHLTWHRCLRKLTCLEEFALRTTAPLVKNVADYELERRVVVGWACGLRRQGQKPIAQSRNHPSLYHIRVWYGRTLQTSALSKWFKDAGHFPLLRPSLPLGNFLDVSTANATDAAAADLTGSLSASLISDGSPAYDPQSAVAAISSCAALTDSVVSLVKHSNELDCRLSWNLLPGECPEGGQDMSVALQELQAVSAVNSRILELVERLSRQQTSDCERLYQLEEQNASLSSEVGRSQCSANRLLYRTKEQVRKEREDIQEAITVMEDKYREKVQSLSATLSQHRKQEKLLIQHVRRVESKLVTVQTTARAELEALKASLWSSKVYAFLCWVCAFVAHVTMAVKHAANVRFRQFTCGCYARVQWCLGVLQTYADLLRLIGMAFLLSLVFLEEIRKGPTEPLDNRPIWESARARLR
ncbi:hypothetical protein OH76DRAFT_1481996 [Lentinus brumalis]|uniref:Uncharacterized protein n=1 Tax=Lentinus brumalis TaxID=2498619 RepID=A0A371DEG4_9APHY|nr:hypothetical protein OH76DRAFT_1481996 [Polyporus brumalis]